MYHLLLQRQFVLLKLIMIFGVTFMSFLILLNLLCNSCLHASKHVKIANYLGSENYKHSNPESNKSVVSMFSTEEMRNIRMQLNSRKNELEQYCRTIGRTSSNLDNVLSNMIIDT